MEQTARTLSIVSENTVDGFKKSHGFVLGTEFGRGQIKLELRCWPERASGFDVQVQIIL